MANGFEDAVLAFAAVALSLLVLYLIYGAIHRAFQAVGFTRQEATAIVLGTLFGGFLNIPIWFSNGWLIAVNVGGAIVPLVVSGVLLRRKPEMLTEALIGVVFVSGATYLTTSVAPEGIVSPFPLWLVPGIVAAAIALVAYWREVDYSAPLAYVSGTVGALIGADVFRFPEFLAQAPPETGAVASIGGAAVFDMVFLTGIIAVTLDLALFQRRRREREPIGLPYFEPEVFTSSTPSRVIRDYKPAEAIALRREAARGPRAERPSRERAPSRERPPPRERPGVREPRAPPRAEPPRVVVEEPVSPADADRLAAHRAWEERLRSGRP
ncbi:MAG TPA: DUF1614 domain-containing protein [Candidatus Thermoplasmatota archaeon]|nr:DUF1614 domain-containing protein [Candidatus Thermoplasmatota archaeon]